MNPVRRIAAAMRGERWWQLVLELALLVAGILIALAVDGWMDDRRDARLERAYLERLERDLQQNIEILDESVAFEKRQVADGVLAYRGLMGVPEIEHEAVAEALSHLMNRLTLRLMLATYRDLLSTGNLGLIRDQALRDLVVRLYEEAERRMTVINRNNELLVDQAFGLPLLDSGLVALRLTSNLATLDGPMRSLQELIGPLPGPDADRLWRLPPDAPERALLANRVLRRTSVSRVHQAQAEELQGQYRGALEAVVAELARGRGR